MDVIKVFFISVLALLAIYDFRQGLLPNKIVYPAAIITLFINILSPEINAMTSLLGGLVLAIFLAVAGLLQKKMGMGDIKLAFLIGLMTGLPVGLIALFCGIFLGGLAAIFLLATGLKGRRDEIPYGPYLVAGAIIAIFYGRFIVDFISGML